MSSLQGRLRWEVELLFRELKSLYGLEKFQTSDQQSWNCWLWRLC